MFEALKISIPFALGIAASPVSIIAIIVLLMTPRAISNSYSFLLGWFNGLMLVGIIVLQIPGLNDASGEPTLVSGWIRIGIGSFLLVLGLLIVKNIPKRGDVVGLPNWLGKIDSARFAHSFILGIIFSGFNIKNASMTASGAVAIGGEGLGSLQEIIVLILFALIASIGVLIPHIIFLMYRSNAESTFANMKVWLIRNRILVLFCVLIVFGGFSLYRGIIIVDSFQGFL